ncbi:MAG TPA: HypC/HybG/HupF family hydrogenase formation chaperone [Pirellulales bacterium]|jgi:hydrogenase expression/formation protein HypC|nr:HypC/HybG/HupF family hydrogenase formation chaperone [Pirellulales bacterium]
MCLAIPAQITELQPDESWALVNIMGVRRRVNIDLLLDDPPVLNDWVLVHVGFAMNKISAERAAEQLKMLAILGEDTAAADEVGGYDLEPPNEVGGYDLEPPNEVGGYNFEPSDAVRSNTEPSEGRPPYSPEEPRDR